MELISLIKKDYLLDIQKFIQNNPDTYINSARVFLIASRYGRINILKYFISINLNAGIELDECLRIACQKGHVKTVKYLLSLGTTIGENRNNAIIYASINGKLDLVKYLVSKGFDINTENNICIRFASRHQHLETVKYLLSLGADHSVITLKHKNIIFGGKILNWYKRQKTRKRILKIKNQLIPIYYHPEMKGGYFSKQKIQRMIDSI